ncbi:hypothetical protein BGX23_001142 [Mortierella sp. AD031]|nr:hypothetical protein BGX23_001142 [Mortierella sp. AD031]KAG0209416.1 hypothetical protein BGX33_005527 [Mortierella sp. NVP41]
MTATTSMTASPAPSNNSHLHSASPSRAGSPVGQESMTGRHHIYRGIKKKSMEYMSIAHSSQQPLAHSLKGEILLSGLDQPGYIQYCFSFDREWMTRRVTLTAMFHGGPEKRLTLEVDQNQRWFKVIEHRLVRSRSFFRSGVAKLSEHTDGMQDADAAFSDAASCCSASPLSPSTSIASGDSVCSIPFEKINLTWTPPPKGSKRGSKRFSFLNPLKDVLTTTTSSSSSTVNLPCTLISGGTSCATMPSTTTTTTTTTTTIATASPTTLSNASPSILSHTPLSPPSLSRCAKGNPSLFSGSTGGTSTYEHLPWLDGCIDLDLGSDFSPSTLLPSLRRATLGINPDQMESHLESLIANPSAITSERMAVVSFPDLELRPVWTHVAYVGQGQEGLSIVEVWTEEEDDDKESTLMEVDSDGLVVRYGDSFTRIPLESSSSSLGA